MNGAPALRFHPSLLRPEIKDFARKDVGFKIDLPQSLNAADVIGVTNEKGEHLARSPRKPLHSEWSKEDKALCLISRDMKVLEIGAGYSPLVPRSQGWNWSFSLLKFHH